MEKTKSQNTSIGAILFGLVLVAFIIRPHFDLWGRLFIAFVIYSCGMVLLNFLVGIVKKLDTILEELRKLDRQSR